ncbi:MULTISPECIES: nuclear transport factor 2 family protein [unclassified Mycobacterium]|uniref:nuclear transport factor 2 family protein n=1 Tax=unclassified Mycobacterium TaxID=2642494 RepID=UPI00089CEB82|nr:MULTISPECIES: nuclear transport factor 2 family protein [unclassified Mycobacterium]SEA39386.1 SnoaL-like domain-containing protein [Mycobacterium sp. 283mftsu]
MYVASCRPGPFGNAPRQVLRSSIGLAAVTTLLCGISTVSASADPLPAPSLCTYSTPQSDTGPEIDAIKQLKTSYFTNIDAKNWDGLRNLLAPNVTVDTLCSAGPVFTDRDSFIAFLKVTLGGAKTHHQGSEPSIHLTSPTTAEGLWTLQDVLIFSDTVGVHGYGHYNDKYQKVNGQWVETYSKLTRTRIDLINPDGTVIQANAPLDQVAAMVKSTLGQ